jgi:hypothetical protein
VAGFAWNGLAADAMEYVEKPMGLSIFATTQQYLGTKIA